MKKLIERTVGNSLRCILPSYWWKRLLNKMAVRIESAESAASNASRIAMLAGMEAADKQEKLYSGSNIKTINGQSILGSGNLEIKVGSDVEQIIFYASDGDAFPLSDAQIAHNVESMQKQRAAFLNKTPVSFLVSVNGNGFQICELPSFYLPSNNTDIPVGFYIMLGGSAQVMVTCNWDGTATVQDVNWIDAEMSTSSKNPVQNKVVTSAIESIALELGEMVGNINTSKADKTYVDEKIANIAAGSTFVIDLTVEEIQDAISNNNGVIDYTLNKELIIDALSKNIPMVVRIGEHSEGYCLAQGELDGTDTLTITFSHSQYKYSLLIGDNDIEVDRRNVESFVTSTPLRLWYSDDLTPAQKEDNVKAYNALMNKEAFDFELLYIDEGEDYYSINKEVVTGFTCHLDSQKVHISILVAATENGFMTEPLYLTSDGTFEFETPPL